MRHTVRIQRRGVFREDAEEKTLRHSDIASPTENAPSADSLFLVKTNLQPVNTSR